ncbi:hypothetical protein EB796_017782 [Bugula neritina]|uniref:Uncharacterized protein n=1 Tax=Bugula neritina TaxID=10212 RepID=A0A7J7JCZ3_BUGNE|nr:hypothetical protein EB796_017782 [Bugula neritina]
MYFTNCRAEPPATQSWCSRYSADNMPPSYDDCSVTEKGDMSSDEDDDETKGKASITDSSDDEVDKAGASSVNTSYNNYQYRGYNPYVQSGAVQQSWQNSFGRGRNQLSMYAYTDSEAESSLAPSTSHYRSTNGLLENSQQRNGVRIQPSHMGSLPIYPVLEHLYRNSPPLFKEYLMKIP